MTIEEVRALLYPFGFLSSAAFGLRFLVQWYQSEQAQRSVVPKLFWRLSFTGNLLLFFHTLIQVQFPMCLLQSFHMVLAWRNLNIMGPRPVKLSTVFTLLLLGAIITPLLFVLQSYLFSLPLIWLRTPTSLLQVGKIEASPLLHTIGISGVAAVSLRFWIQWWQTECSKTSSLPPIFWRLSLLGACLASYYFFMIQDWVNLVGPLVAIVPYTRNLQLLKKTLGQEKQKKAPVDLFVVCGEPSGDLLAAEAVTALLQRFPSLKIEGVTGPNLRAAGVQTIFPMEQLRVMGFTAVIRALPRIFLLRRALIQAILSQKNSPVLFIDQPSFSLNIGKRLKRAGYKGKLLQLVAPSVWAWGKTRAQEYANIFSKLLTLFKFEEEHFSHLMPCRWIGLPQAKTIQDSKESSPQQKKEYIALFPGSRPFEIEKNLRLQLEAIRPLLQEDPTIRVGIALAPTIKTLPLKGLQIPTQVEIVPAERRYELMQKAKIALAKSGTVTLELGLFQVPTIVTYALTPLNYLFARFWINPKIPYFSLPNILTNQEICKEHIRFPVRVGEIRASCRAFLLQDSTIDEQNRREQAYKRLLQEVLPPIPPSEALLDELLLVLQGGE